MLLLEIIEIGLERPDLTFQSVDLLLPGWSDLDLRLATTLADAESAPIDLEWSSKTSCIRLKNVRCWLTCIASNCTDAGRRRQTERTICAKRRCVLVSDLPARQPLVTTPEARKLYPFG